MANYLSDNRTVKKEQIEVYCIKYGVNFNSDRIIRNGDFFLQKSLKRKSKKNNHPRTIQVPSNSFELCLNKESKL
ncbi:MAG: hypothetical protein L3J41_15160 [Melioribacteraceae bacterium]|nr:hypothetical protein [Melioribacteraceae bacterium]